MRLCELIKNTEHIETEKDAEITAICYDSRKVTPGSLFVAIRGYKEDGHRFIKAAVENGAAAILAEEPVDCPVPVVLCADTRKALSEVAAVFYGCPADKLKIIGVTGTNGKTTVTYLIKQILELIGIKTGLIGTNQNMIGNRVLQAERTTPESLELHKLFSQMVEEGVTHVVMEVSSHSLALGRTHGIHFHEAVFTNLTQEHLDFHGDMETYTACKTKLFQHARHGVINVDDQHAGKFLEAATCPLMTYGIENAGDFCAKDVRFSQRGVIFGIEMGGTTYELRLGIPGKFSVYNALSRS